VLVSATTRTGSLYLRVQFSICERWFVQGGQPVGSVEQAIYPPPAQFSLQKARNGVRRQQPGGLGFPGQGIWQSESEFKLCHRRHRP